MKKSLIGKRVHMYTCVSNGNFYPSNEKDKQLNDIKNKVQSFLELQRFLHCEGTDSN